MNPVGEQRDPHDPVRVATYLAPHVLPVYRLAAERIGEAIGVEAELVVGTDPEDLAGGVQHAAFLCSPPALALADRDPAAVEILAAPVLTGKRYGDRPVHYSDLIVRAGDPARSFADLRGWSWAFNEEASHSGYGIMLATLAQRGVGRDFFGRIERTGSHARSLRRVASGEVDSAAIDAQVLELELANDPELGARIRVLEALGPSPIQPVVASTSLTIDDRARIRHALVDLGRDPADRAVLRSCLIERFVPVSSEDYAPIRRMRAAVEAAGLDPVSASPGTEGGPGDAGPIPRRRGTGKKG
ncbi:MAG: PhnD/SsuA/transferrin family substrate-binding protein [Actinomycetota bacterium]